MTVRAVWCLTAVWSAGLLTGQAIPIPIRWLLLTCITGFLLIPRLERFNRPAALLLVFLLASVAGAQTGIRLNTGTRMGEGGPKQGLLNPHFNPLIRLADADTVRAGPTEPLLSERPPWASGPVWSMVQAIIFNRRDRLPYEWTAAFRSVGASHLIAVSGLHLGILLGALLTVMKIARIGRAGSAILSIAASWSYILFIGAPPSAVRAGLMTSIGLSVWGAGKLPQPDRLLPAAVLTALILRPSLIASVGFQLSVTAVIGIRLGLRGFIVRDLESMRGRFSALFRITLGAQAGVLPVQILTFGCISPLAPLVNVIAVPLMGVWLPSAVTSLCLGFFLPPAAVLAGAFCNGVGNMLLWWIYIWSSVPGVVVPVPAAAAWLAALGLVFWAVGGRARNAALACLVAVVWFPALENGAPRICFLDVGQGDAMVIETGSPRRIVVVDSGPAFVSWSAGRHVVAPYLRARGIRRIDLLVATHPDADHVGGMVALAEEFQLGMFMRGCWYPEDAKSALKLEEGIRAAGVGTLIPGSGDRIILDNRSCLDVLAGERPGGAGGSGGLSSNNRSLVLRLQLQELSVLLCGDLERSGEKLLVPYRQYLPSTVLKVPHHGSQNVLSEWLLEATCPGLAVVSVGSRNRYGHPSDELLERLRNAGIEIWRTDHSGALVLQP